MADNSSMNNKDNKDNKDNKNDSGENTGEINNLNFFDLKAGGDKKQSVDEIRKKIREVLLNYNPALPKNAGPYRSSALNIPNPVSTTGDSLFLRTNNKKNEMDDWERNSSVIMKKQMKELESKQSELYETMNEVREWISESKAQSARIQRQVEKSNEQYETAIGEVGGIKSVLEETERNFDREVTVFKDEIRDSRNSILGMIALFASFFSFISVSINIFSKSLDVPTAISIVLVLWICLMSFLYVFMNALKNGMESFTGKLLFEHFIVIAIAIIFCLAIPKVIFNGLSGFSKVESVVVQKEKLAK